jgi:tetratricopeptide (TPR) repeat protein
VIPALSLAMIVRNEAQLLPECLELARQWADEICVVDTGSTDATPQIAANAGCRLAHQRWNDDFAAARNASLAQCTKDWIFILDADERIDPEDRAALRELMMQPPAGWRFVTRNYTRRTDLSGFVACREGDPAARGFPGWYPSTKVRLFPNHLGARFEGRVHELINPALERLGLPLRMCEVPVHHYPLLKDEAALARKRALYLRLGELKVAAAPNDPQAHAELGHQYTESGQYARAAAAYQRALHRAPGNAELLKDLGAVLHLLQRPNEAHQALELATRIDPGLTDAWRNLGVVAAEAEDWRQALRHFDTALRLSPQSAELHYYRAVALQRLGRADEARAAARECLSLRADHPEAGQLLRP